MVKFSVVSIKDLAKLINHFDNYPLITQKRTDFELFKQVFLSGGGRGAFNS